MAGFSGDFLLRFIAETAQVERELAKLQSKGAAASKQSAAQIQATRSGLAGEISLAGLGVTNPATAGRARGALSSLANYLDSIGKLDEITKGVPLRQVQANIKSAFEKFNDPEGQMLWHSREAAKETTAALRGTGSKILGTSTQSPAADAEEAYARTVGVLQGETAKKAAAVTASTVATQQSTEKVRVAENADEQIRRQAAESHAKYARAKALEADTAQKAQLDEAARIQGDRKAADKLAGKEGQAAYNAANAQRIGAMQAQAASARVAARTAQLAQQMDEKALREKAQEVVLQEQYNRALNQQVKAQAKQAGMRYHLSSGGGQGNFRGGLGGFDFATGFRSTIRYGLPAALLYGTVSGIGNIIREASELQVELGLLESQFELSADAGAAFGGLSFDELRKQIVSVSKESLTAADITASVTRQLSAAFAGTEGFDLEAESTTALQFAKVTGLPVQEITDSITAIRLAFEDSDVTVQQFADTTTFLEARFGVLSKEIATFVGDIAPLGKELGFTYQQLAGVAAVAQRASGRSGAVLSEQLGRILPALRDRQGELIEILSGNREAAKEINGIAAAFGAGDIPKVLQGLSAAYGSLDRGQKNAIGALVGSRREAATLFALLSRNEDLNDVLSGKAFEGGASEGSFQKRWENYSKTVTATFERLKRATEEFGLALFDSGLGDALVNLTQMLTGLVDVVNLLLQALGEINSFLGGMPAKFLVTAAAVGALVKAMQALAATRAATAITGALSGAAGAGILGGTVAPTVGAYSPYVTPAVGAGIGGFFAGQAAKSPLLGKFASLGVPGATGAPAAFFAAAAAVGAALLTQEAVKQLTEFRNEVQSARDSFADQVEKELEAGADPEELLRIAGQTQDTGFKANIGRFISGTKTPYQETLDVIQKRAKDDNVAFLEKVLEDLPVDEGKLEFNRFGQLVPGEGSKGAVESILNRLKESDGTSDDLNAAVEALKEEFPEQAKIIEELAARRARMSAAAKRAETTVAAAVASADRTQLTAAEAEAEFKVGRIGREQYISVLEANARTLERAVKLADEAGTADQVLIDRAAEARRKANEALLESETRSLDASNLLQELGGGSDVDLAKNAVEIAQITLKFAEGSDAKFAAAESVLKAQQDAFNAFVESGATAAERLRRAQQGFTLDPEALKVVIGVVLENNADVKRVASEIGITVEQLTGVMVSAIDAQGRFNASIIESMIRQKALIAIAVLQSAKAATTNIHIIRAKDAQIAEILAGVEADIAALSNAVTGVVPPGGFGGGISDADEKALAEEAKAEAEAAAREAEQLRKEAEQRAKEAREAAKALELARLDLALAYVESDPVAAARSAQAQANVAIKYADNEAERLQAMADKIRADHALRDAMYDIGTAQIELLSAMAEAAGDQVEVARLAVQQAERELYVAGAHGQGSAAYTNAQAELVRAQAELRDAQLQEQLDTYQFMADMGQITTQQLIGYLESLLTIPELTEEQIRDIQLQIKNLRDELGSEFQFNLPTQLYALPSAYEVRRTNELGVGSGGSYNYAPTTTVNVYAETGASADDIAEAVVTAIGEPTRYGMQPRKY